MPTKLYKQVIVSKRKKERKIERRKERRKEKRKKEPYLVSSKDFKLEGR